MNNNNHQSLQQIKIPFGQFARIKCKECGGKMFQHVNLFRWWKIPDLLKYKFGDKVHICAQLFTCAECGQICDEVSGPAIPPGTTEEDLVIILCSNDECKCEEFTALNITYIVPHTYKPVLQGASRISIEYMLCAECGTYIKEINMYPLPEGVKWEPK